MEGGVSKILETQEWAFPKPIILARYVRTYFFWWINFFYQKWQKLPELSEDPKKGLKVHSIQCKFWNRPKHPLFWLRIKCILMFECNFFSRHFTQNFPMCSSSQNSKCNCSSWWFPQNLSSQRGTKWLWYKYSLESQAHYSKTLEWINMYQFVRLSHNFTYIHLLSYQNTIIFFNRICVQCPTVEIAVI